MRRFGLSILVLGMSTWLTWDLARAAEPPRHLLDAVAGESRPEADKKRDPQRKPAEVLAFFGIQPGDSVVELMCGSGYYVDILSRAVGPEGKVYAHNSPFVLNRYAEKPISERLANPDLANVTRLNTEPESPEIPDGVDAVLNILFYHDLYWQEVDRAKMNAAVLKALKPGGIYGVIDHRAKPGTGSSGAKTLHRVEAELVKSEILAAGFELVAESDLLHRKEDTLDFNVFRNVRTGRDRTDRFIFKFKKPEGTP